MKKIKKELPMAILIISLGFLFVVCAIARAEQIDTQNQSRIKINDTFIIAK